MATWSSSDRLRERVGSSATNPNWRSARSRAANLLSLAIVLKYPLSSSEHVIRIPNEGFVAFRSAAFLIAKGTSIIEKSIHILDSMR
jgi:hypothetical protein